MKNRIFAMKTAAEKKRHLEAILRISSGGRIDEGLLEAILRNVSIHKQYKISSFSSKRSFEKALNRANKENTFLSPLRAKERHQSAVITRPMQSFKMFGFKYAIFIYAPNHKGNEAKKCPTVSKSASRVRF